MHGRRSASRRRNGFGRAAVSRLREDRARTFERGEAPPLAVRHCGGHAAQCRLFNAENWTMPQVDIIVGPPFSGKNIFIESEIARREEDGELGLIAVDYSGLYSAVIPGSESALRDQALADTGAARFAGGLFESAVAILAARELSGFVATNSPSRAVELSGRLESRVLNLDIGVEDLASRIENHMTKLARTVKRATREGIVGRCRGAAVRYLSESPVLVGKARNVKREGKRWRDVGPVQAFDRDNFRQGLTPAGREIVAQFEADNFVDWRPKDVLHNLLVATGRR